MRATAYEPFRFQGEDEIREWHVVFTGVGLFAESPVSRSVLTDWIEGNINGKCGETWRISSYSSPAYAAFLDEEDALMCFLAFQ